MKTTNIHRITHLESFVFDLRDIIYWIYLVYVCIEFGIHIHTRCQSCARLIILSSKMPLLARTALLRQQALRSRMNVQARAYHVCPSSI